MKHSVVVLVCDFCKTEGDAVDTHQIDGKVVEVCAKCWHQRRASDIVKRARSPRRQQRRTGQLHAVS